MKFCASPITKVALAIAAELNANYPAIEAPYLDLHRHPELAFQEVETAKKLAEKVKALGFDVTTGVGGVAAILRNGPGPVVITVGSIHGGTQASIAREVKREAFAAGAPKEPLVEVRPGTDAVYNDPGLTMRMAGTLQKSLGAAQVVEMPAKMTSEDFANYGQAGTKAVLLHIGAVEPGKLAAITAKTSILLDLLGKK